VDSATHYLGNLRNLWMSSVVTVAWLASTVPDYADQQEPETKSINSLLVFEICTLKLPDALPEIVRNRS